MYDLRVVIPSPFRVPVLEELHLGHPGIVRSKELARSYVWWPGSPKWVRGTVLKKTGPVSYNVTVTTPQGKLIWRRHLDQLLAGAGTVATLRASDRDLTEGFLALPESQAGDQTTSEELVPVESGPPAPAPPSETPVP
ncbi:uncharacterized protein LOC119385328 [Rhipicephalus sanguineus]|uniref:uncharacterized protein LOC119385328 n=1 Tax=Rhipicephalus sanguineus TaxID=34632 RepID=UPI0020C55377|nr:uncharacterized protein LOC119385328 [Rhipicephalus sanguineus]